VAVAEANPTSLIGGKDNSTTEANPLAKSASGIRPWPVASAVNATFAAPSDAARARLFETMAWITSGDEP
jgi:hypothetical protein